jgi:hypothetical protein
MNKHTVVESETQLGRHSSSCQAGQNSKDGNRLHDDRCSSREIEWMYSSFLIWGLYLYP